MIMIMAVFWTAAPCSLVDVSELLVASIIALVVDPASIS